MKSYQKSKNQPGALGPGYRTPDFIKQSKFAKSPSQNRAKFNPAQFKTQHKG